MDENTDRTPHPEDPAEGASDIDGVDGSAADERTGATDAVRGGPGRGADGRPEHNPAHNTAPDGVDGEHAHGGALQGDASADGGALQGDASADGAKGGAIQGDSSGDGTGGAIQGDASPDRGAPLGGHETTEEQLAADNEVEDDSLKTLDPDDPPA